VKHRICGNVAFKTEAEKGKILSACIFAAMIEYISLYGDKHL
jgi:hypothetical protein